MVCVSPYVMRQLWKTILLGNFTFFLAMVWTMQRVNTVPMCVPTTQFSTLQTNLRHCQCPDTVRKTITASAAPKDKHHINFKTRNNISVLKERKQNNSQDQNYFSFVQNTSFVRIKNLIDILDSILSQVKNHVLKDDLMKVRYTLMNAMKEFEPQKMKMEQTAEKIDQVVCPEIYKGTLYGYPFYEKGFLTKQCKGAIQLKELVTVVFNWVKTSRDICKYDYKVINSINKHCPNCHIIIGLSTGCFSGKEIHNNVTFMEFSTSLFPGMIWNGLISLVRTPYTYIGRDLYYFNNDTKLYRFIRELNQLNASIVGGSVKNLDGTWSMGCDQMMYKNHTLKFISGYKTSKHECIFCDYIQGSFLARTEHLNKLKFDERFSNNNMLFYDYFLKHSSNRKIVVVCPDSMSHVKIMHKHMLIKSAYLPLAQIWKINQFTFMNRHICFTCEELHIDCTFMTGMAVPPCCLQMLSKQIKFIMKACQQNGIICELQEGTLLGAVKMNKALPWERDADITFLSSNFSALLNIQETFATYGYSLIKGDSTRCCVEGRVAGGTFEVKRGSKWTPWTVQLYGQHRMDTEWLISQGLKPTQVYFDGMWVNVPRNPGQHVRNRYGYEIYRHAQHWISLGKYNGWDQYDTSGFTACIVPGRHDCLDQYKADGNIQFHNNNM